MKLSLEKIFEDTNSYYKQYIDILESQYNKLIEDSFDNLLKQIKLSIYRQLNNNSFNNYEKVAILPLREAKYVLYLAELEGKKFELKEFLKNLNFEIYISQDGFILKKTTYLDLLKEDDAR